MQHNPSPSPLNKVSTASFWPRWPMDWRILSLIYVKFCIPWIGYCLFRRFNLLSIFFFSFAFSSPFRFSFFPFLFNETEKETWSYFSFAWILKWVIIKSIFGDWSQNNALHRPWPRDAKKTWKGAWTLERILIWWNENRNAIHKEWFT